MKHTKAREGLLRILADRGPSRVVDLEHATRRHHSNVYNDVRFLQNHGIIRVYKEGLRLYYLDIEGVIDALNIGADPQRIIGHINNLSQSGSPGVFGVEYLREFLTDLCNLAGSQNALAGSLKAWGRMPDYMRLLEMWLILKGKDSLFTREKEKKIGENPDFILLRRALRRLRGLNLPPA